MLGTAPPRRPPLSFLSLGPGSALRGDGLDERGLRLLRILIVVVLVVVFGLGLLRRIGRQ